MGAAGANSITFGGAATLEIDNAALSHVKPTHNTFGNTIQSFGANDVIDLTGFSFATGATASYSSNIDLLTVKSGALSDTLTLTTALSKPVFHLTSDHHGGTEITVVDGQSTVGYSGASSGGSLSVSDGTHAANIALLVNYMASAFVLSSDGHGGTNLVAPPASAPLNLAQPSLHAA